MVHISRGGWPVQQDPNVVATLTVAVLDQWCEAQLALVNIERVPDPKVPDCTAVRATFADDGSLDLIVHERTTGYDVEEVQFKSWPPRGI